MRVAGIDIPDHLRLEVGLQAIYGIGRSNIQSLLTQTQINPDKRGKELTDEEISRIQKVLDTMLSGGELRRQIAQNISRLKNINSYRGLRHKHNLPVHGQRTKTNARTKRGKRMTVGAFKKKEMAKQEQTAKQKE